VDYKNLGAEELGSVYESLLELHPIINVDAGAFELKTFAGSERKTTGSYYTHDSLVQALLDSALEPVIADKIRSKKGTATADALLGLKICDPAVGSGHFLIRAAHRIAKRIAAARSGEDEPSPEATRAARREVIGRCLYGIDINPMATELCKVNLWLEALEPGKPLSFLDHHIRVGNSLLGTTPALIAKGIPDDAFKPIEGDDKKVCAELKKLNARERKGYGVLFVSEDTSNFKELRNAALAVDELADDTPKAIHQKEDAHAATQHSYNFLRSKELADTWCAAFVIRKVFKSGTSDPVGITHSHLVTVAKGDPLQQELLCEVRCLAGGYQFFHWHLAFPDVFQVPPAGQNPDNELCGWNGGFDVILGNPPWERVKLAEKEWFAAHGCENIATAPNAAARKRLIEALKTEDPVLYQGFAEDVRRAEGESQLFRKSGLYPLCGCGDINLYAVFAECMRSHLRANGRAGCVLPTGIATDDTTKFFFQDLVEKRSLFSLFDFENRNAIFRGVHRSYKFCLLTVGNGLSPSASAAEFVFFALAVEDLKDADKRFTLSAEEIALLNPATRTCPIFRSKRDAEITKSVYRNSSTLGQIRPPVAFFPKIDMSDEVGEFARAAEHFNGEPPLPRLNVDGQPFIQLYESK